MVGTTLLKSPFHLARSSSFSYECRACSRCCRGKRIPINPYEVARLAEHLGVSTTEFLARHTETGGAVLARREDTTCVFLGEKGCTVHAARPLACRLYPLGRQRAGDGAESFAELHPHPGSEGVYGEAGTVDAYLSSQEVARHVAAADAYGEILARMLNALARREAFEEAQDAAHRALESGPAPGADNLLDMDAMVSQFCADHGKSAPADVEGKTRLHIEALAEFVRGLEGASR